MTEAEYCKFVRVKEACLRNNVEGVGFLCEVIDRYQEALRQIVKHEPAEASWTNAEAMAMALLARKALGE